MKGEVTYHYSELVTTQNCDFMKQEAFVKAHLAGIATGSFNGIDRPWRIYNLCWSAYHATQLEGDFVECGVDKGGTAKAVMTYVNFNELDKTFYLLDTFNGLVPELISESEKNRGIVANGKFKLGGYVECYEEVKELFKDDRVEIIRGAIPETLSKVKAEKIAYLSIDMNCVIPEIAAANFFWDKMTSGGIIILDDYGWKIHIEQKQAFDKFAEERNVKVMSTPTGQGIIIKP